MKLLFHLGHPAHFHLFKNTIKYLQDQGNEITIVIKKKDILENLLQLSNIEYVNLLPKGRRNNKLGILTGMLKTDFKLLLFSRKFKPDLMIGTSYAIAHVGKILNIRSLNFNEDDFDVVPFYSKFSYPFSTYILTPEVCRTGKWEYKTIKYHGYHELAYLHPNHFKPDRQIVEKYFSPDEKFFIIRFAKLSAHHDTGIQGINSEIAQKLINILHPHGKIYITSERKLESQFEQYRININPLDIHHVMAFSELFIGDSQTMAAEAGVLGIPFIRFNDFVGKIGYMNELENKYKLGFGFKSDESVMLLEKVETLVNTKNLKDEFQKRRLKMLTENIDVSGFITWFIEQYPESVNIMKDNPDFQLKFL